MRTALVLTCALLGACASTPSAEEVAEAERRFAADAIPLGVADSFRKHAAPDAIVFQPDPVNLHAAYAGRKSRVGPPHLVWWPAWAGISASGDLGFTTGPFVVGEDRAFGHYFTIWRRQPDGGWKWVYDGGPSTRARSPKKPDAPVLHLKPTRARSRSAEAAMVEVRSVEARLAGLAAVDTVAAYRAYLSPDAQIMGSDVEPAAGRDGQEAELARRPKAVRLEPLGGSASKAGDLAWTYGTANWTAEKPGRGHYVRVWQKRRAGWMLVFDEILERQG